MPQADANLFKQCTNSCALAEAKRKSVSGMGKSSFYAVQLERALQNTA